MERKTWYYARDVIPIGVFSKQELLDLRSKGHIQDNNLIWCEGMDDWVPFSSKFKIEENDNKESSALEEEILNDSSFRNEEANANSDIVGVKRNLQDSVVVCIKKSFVFSGRASRSEYWWFILFAALISVLSEIVDFLTFSPGVFLGFSGLISLVLFFPILSVAIRRMHDVKRSGWWVGSLYLLPLALMIPFMFILGFGLYVDEVYWMFAIIGFFYLINAVVFFVFTLKKGIS